MIDTGERVAAMAAGRRHGRAGRMARDPGQRAAAGVSRPAAAGARPGRSDAAAGVAPAAPPAAAAHHVRADALPAHVGRPRLQLLRGAHLPRQFQRDEPARGRRGRRLRSVVGFRHVRAPGRHRRQVAAAHRQQCLHDAGPGCFRHFYLHRRSMINLFFFLLIRHILT